MQPHRGVTILVLGILGIFVCQICGIIAWVMANKDLAAMNAGQMDPVGRDQTNAGKICGIIGTIILIISFIGIALYLLFFVVLVGGAAAASGLEAIETLPSPQ